MWLVLADRADEAAMWAFLGLKRRGLEPLEYILPEELVSGARFFQRLSGAREASCVELADGRRIDSVEVRGVLNRLTCLPQAKAGGPEGAYVAAEYHAWVMSWLAGLACPVLSPPGYGLLCGEARSDVEWAALARAASLDFDPLHRTCEDEARSGPPGDAAETVFVVAGEVVAPREDRLLDSACQELAALAGAPVLGVYFRTGPDGRRLFCEATALPDLRAGGRALLDAIGRALRA
jgi:hypothetical protein